MFDGKITDNFIEFLIPGSSSEFIDMDSFSAEIKVRITKEDGTLLDNTSHVSLVDGFFHRMFQSHSVFLNGVQTESNPYFGLMNNIKSYLNMDKNVLKNLGVNMCYKPLETPIIEVVDAAYFKSHEPKQIAHDIIHCAGPLSFDMSTTDSYLMDSIDVRIRLDLANSAILLMSHDNKKYKYSVELSKLYCRKVIPVPSAMITLNKSLENNKYVEYMFDRPLHRMIIFPSNQQALNVENPFNGVVPHKIVVSMIDQVAFNGSYDTNANFLSHNNVTDISLDINGNTIGNIKGVFPGVVAQAFYQTLNGIGFRNTKNLITKENFVSGRTLFVFDTRASDSEDTLNLEKNANVRLNIRCGAPALSNKVVFIVGYTLGVIHINAARRVYPNFLQ